MTAAAHPFDIGGRLIPAHQRDTSAVLDVIFRNLMLCRPSACRPMPSRRMGKGWHWSLRSKAPTSANASMPCSGSAHLLC